MLSDFVTLRKNLGAQLQRYQFDIGKEPSLQSIAQALAITLYNRRFFPFYTFNLVCGLDENNNGKVYGYDALGSYDFKNCIVQGTGRDILSPLLDNYING